MADKSKVKLTDDQILSLLRSDIDKAKGIQDDLATFREDYYNFFRGVPYGNERDGWSQSVAPVIWTNHQANLSSLMEIFSDDFFILKSEDQERALKFQKLIKYQMFRKQDGFRRLYDFFYDVGLYHYGVMKVYYKEDYDLQTDTYDRLTAEQMQMLSQQPETTVSKYQETSIPGAIDPYSGTPGAPTIVYDKVKAIRRNVTYAGATFDVVPPWEFFYSPDCVVSDWGSIDGRLVYHQVKRTLNDVRKKERGGIYRKGTFDRCKDSGKTAEIVQPDELAVKFLADGTTQFPTTTDSEQSTGEANFIDLNREVIIRECYCKMDIDGDGLLEPCIVDIINDDIIARVEENVYRRPCFRIGGLLPEPHKVVSISPVSVLENDQKVMTNLLRFIQDTAAMQCYRNVVTNDVRMQQMLQNRKPFDVILGDPQKIGEVPVQTADPFILKAWELMKGENEEKTGTSRYNQGQDSRSLNKTATGISLISQNSAKRMRMSAKLIGVGAIQGLIKDFIFINQKFPTKDPIQLLGENLTISPEDMKGNVDIEIDVGVAPSERQAIAQQIDTLVQFGTQAGMNMGIMTPAHILKAQKKKYALLNLTIDDCLINEQELKQNMEAAKQNPPKPDLKEYVQLDKLYPLLTRQEQAQILQQFGIQADQQAQQTGLPSAKDIIDLQKQREKIQADQQTHQAEMMAKQQEHAISMRERQHEQDHAVREHIMQRESEDKAAKQKILEMAVQHRMEQERAAAAAKNNKP